MNLVVFRGFVCKDPKMGTYGDSGKIAYFTLGCKRKRKKDESDFVNFKCFGKQAEVIEQYVKKGSQIEVQAHIQTGSYDKDGQKVYTTEFIVDSFEFVGGSGGSNSATGSAPAPQKEAPKAAASDNPDGFIEVPEGVDDGIPFSY